MRLLFYEDVRAAGGEIFLVGGAVRDRLMGRPSKDADFLVRGIPIEALEEILARHGRVERVGKSFGVLKFATSGGETLDVALPRKERSTGVRHIDFEVQADPLLPVEEDLGRRDFTINAMAQEIASPDGAPGRLVDPFGGKADLEARRLHMVFDRAFEEDPLRVFRGVQFAARFRLEIEPRTLAAMKAALPLLKTVSPERVIQELGKLLTAERPSIGFYLLRELGVLAELFPELAAMSGVEQPPEYHVADVFDHTMMVVDAAANDPEIEARGDPELLLAALYHDAGKPSCMERHPDDGRITFYGHQHVSMEIAKERLSYWKSGMIGASPERTARLISRHMFDTQADFSDRAIRRFIRSIGPDLVGKLLDLRLADRRGQRNPTRVEDLMALRRRVQEELARKVPLDVKALAISGKDLLERGYRAGPAVGHELERLLGLVIDDPARNTREYLLNALQPPL